MTTIRYAGYKRVDLQGFKFYRPFFSDLLGRNPRYSRRVFRRAHEAVNWGVMVAARFPFKVVEVSLVDKPL
jgi:hypothetical protein